MSPSPRATRHAHRLTFIKIVDNRKRPVVLRVDKLHSGFIISARKREVVQRDPVFKIVKGHIKEHLKNLPLFGLI